MEGSGLSGDIRVVRSVPVRLHPNRTDTSWPEEYAVRAAPPLPPSPIVPRASVDGPWRLLGHVRGDPSRIGRWLIFPQPCLGRLADDSHAWSFDDGVAELVEAWRQLPSFRRETG